MKIKALWGFRGDAGKLGNAVVKRGEVFEGVEDEYAHILIGKGLAVAVEAEPKSNKQAKPDEASVTGPGTTNLAAPETVKSVEDDRAELITKLEQAGISFDKRWGVAKLREALDEGK